MYFLPWRTLLFSLLPRRLYSFCALLLFYRRQKILSKPDGLVGSLDVDLPLSYFPLCGPVLFTELGTCLLSSASFQAVSSFLAFEALQGCWHILLNSLEILAVFHFLRSMRMIKCQDVGVGLDLFFTFFNGDFFSSDVCHCFPSAVVISPVVTNVNSLLLITPLKVFSLSWGYALHLVVRKLHF